MKSMRASVHSVSCLFAASFCFSHLAITMAAAPAVKAFPAAEGFGANAAGGRGGRVLEVTTLDVVTMAFWSLSGIWLAWELKTTRLWGAPSLVVGLGLFVLFAALI
jgi:hypothetical protein